MKFVPHNLSVLFVKYSVSIVSARVIQHVPVVPQHPLCIWYCYYVNGVMF